MDTYRFLHLSVKVMTGLILFFLLFSVTSFGQIKTNYSDITPKEILVKPLFDTVNYIDNSVRLSIVDFLKSQKLDPSKYFVDSSISKRGDTLYIHLWDYNGLKRLKEIEKLNEKSEPQITMLGNPGYCGTIYFDNKRKNIIGFYLWE